RPVDPEERVRERERLDVPTIARRHGRRGERLTTHSRKRKRKRNPTAVQSGNRHATPLGERSRLRSSRLNRPYGTAVKRSFVPSGPRRAQAGSCLPSRIGPIPDQAHAVTSRVTSWAFWFFRSGSYPKRLINLVVREQAIGSAMPRSGRRSAEEARRKIRS